MIPAWVFVALIVVFCAGAWYLGYTHAGAMEMMERTVAADRQVLLGLLREERESHAAANDKWASILNDAEERHAKDYETLVKGITGQNQPPPPDAEYIPHEPDAQERLSRKVSEDTVNRGVEILEAKYRAAGLQIDKQTIRDEVEAMLDGRPLSTL